MNFIDPLGLAEGDPDTGQDVEIRKPFANPEDRHAVGHACSTICCHQAPPMPSSGDLSIGDLSQLLNWPPGLPTTGPEPPTQEELDQQAANREIMQPINDLLENYGNPNPGSPSENLLNQPSISGVPSTPKWRVPFQVDPRKIGGKDVSWYHWGAGNVYFRLVRPPASALGGAARGLYQLGSDAARMQNPFLSLSEKSAIVNGYINGIASIPQSWNELTPLEKADTAVGEAFMLGTGIGVSRYAGRFRNVPRGTVWNRIKATQEVWPETSIPRSFELTTQKGQRVWVHGNATEHIAERVIDVAAETGPRITQELGRIVSQSQLKSLEAAVNAATRNGVKFDDIICVGGWELKFARPRNPGDLPALIHALPLE